MLLNFNKKNRTGGGVKTKPISSKGKLILLIIFCFLSGTIGIYVADSCFSGKRELPFPASSIKKPKYIHLQGEPTGPTASISREEYLHIQNFKKYMDSMAKTPSGRRTFDSIITARPGLIDSILLIEHIYLSQTKE